MNNNKVRKKTINDFNNQWKLQGELNSDYWASDEILVDQFSGIFSLKEIENKIICDVGAGTGRVIKTLLKSNPKISKSKIINSKNEDLSVKSIKQKKFITENMALIYVKQKKFKEAIKIYEKLISLNSKKKSYFAKKIKNLKN